MCKVSLILGTMTFGEQVFGRDVYNMIDYYLSQGYDELDTAYVYNGGLSEKLIGEAVSGMDASTIKISTKINPRITGKLDYDAVVSQFDKSLTRLGVKKIDTLYLHFPDSKTPIEHALAACDELYNADKISRLGLSNFPAWMVADVYHLCKSHNWIRPQVYEGLYNVLSRHAERELNSALDYYGLSFYAYNPLAGGILTNKYSSVETVVKSGRFLNRPNYQKRYWKESYFNAVNDIKCICEKHDANIINVSYRWLAFHSMLRPERGDGIIIGASKLEHLTQNIDSLSHGELPSEIVDELEHAWTICRDAAPEYFRFYTTTG